MIIEFSSLMLFFIVFLYLAIISLINHTRRNVNYKKEFLNLCIFISSLLIISQTLFPIRFNYAFEGFQIYNLIPFKVPYEIYTQFSFSYFIYQVFGNIFMFVPFGYFLYQKTYNNKFKTILISFLTSFSIEFIQGFIPYRFCEIDDIWLNTLGGLIGVIICVVVDKIHRSSRLNNSIANTNNVK